MGFEIVSFINCHNNLPPSLIFFSARKQRPVTRSTTAVYIRIKLSYWRSRQDCRRIDITQLFRWV